MQIIWNIILLHYFKLPRFELISGGETFQK